MTDVLDFHVASDAERLAAHRNVFDVWSKGRSLDEHLRHRTAAPTFRHARWFVGCLRGEVVTSLAGHPVQFCIEEKIFPGVAVGSVHTRAEARGRGYARQLIAWVERHERQRGIGLSVLYSDIQPEYYARQGYVLCPAWQGWRDSAAPFNEDASEGFRIEPIDAAGHLPRIKQLYAGHYRSLPLSIARDDAYWAMMLEKFSADVFHALLSPAGQWAGYALLGVRAGSWQIVDFALADQTDVLARRFYAALMAAARAANVTRGGGWLTKTAAAREYFSLAPRTAEITMLKPLAWTGRLTDAMLAAAGHICELDHV